MSLGDPPAFELPVKIILNAFLKPLQERFERNRVGLSLLNERELRESILRDQETLRGMVNSQRVYERDLWALLREYDAAAGGGGSIKGSHHHRHQLTPAQTAQAEHIL